MSKAPKDPQGDPTSLGNLLIDWEIITKDELEYALREQATLRGDDLLGRLLVANGACTEDDINMAMSAQASMRAANKRECAMAVADLAIERRRRDSLVVRRNNIIEKAAEVERSLGNGKRQQSVTPSSITPILVKPSDS